MHAYTSRLLLACASLHVYIPTGEDIDRPLCFCIIYMRVCGGEDSHVWGASGSGGVFTAYQILYGDL